MRNIGSIPALLLLGANVFAAEISAPGNELQSRIIAAYAAGERSMRVSPGVYHIECQKDQTWHLRFTRMRDCIIDATGATIIFDTRDKRGLAFEDCTNVSFIGAVLLRETPPFSQGDIRAIAVDRASVDITVHDGYPTDIDDPRYRDTRRAMKISLLRKLSLPFTEADSALIDAVILRHAVRHGKWAAHRYAGDIGVIEGRRVWFVHSATHQVFIRLDGGAAVIYAEPMPRDGMAVLRERIADDDGSILERHCDMLLQYLCRTIRPIDIRENGLETAHPAPDVYEETMRFT